MPIETETKYGFTPTTVVCLLALVGCSSTPVLRFCPQSDITAYELAQIVNAMNSEKAMLALLERHPEIRRHVLSANLQCLNREDDHGRH